MKRSIVAAMIFAFSTMPVAAIADPAPPASAAADVPLDEAKVAIGRDIIAVVLPPDQRDKIMNGVLSAMMTNIMSGTLQGLGIDDKVASDPEIGAIFQKFVERQKSLAMEDIHAALPGLVEAYAHAYARMFSLEDLKGIRTFVQTPTGARFMQRSAGLLTDPDVAEWQRKLASQGAARQENELRLFKSQLNAAGLKVPSAT